MKLCMGCMNQIEDHLETCPYCGFNESTLRQESYYLDPGTIIGGKYIVGKVLSYGGHTVSYLGMDAEANRKVIVKEYLPSDFSTRSEGEKEVTIYSGDGQIQFERGLTNFLNEANRIQHLQNPDGIARIYDCVAENDTGYVISEYVEGRTLKEILDSGKTYAAKDAQIFIKQILQGLVEVHKMNIIHCDICPENIMVTNSGKIKLMDFGATRYVTTANSKSLSIILKRGYAPEEQYRSRGVRGPWTDVYALGAVMYRMITGIVPQESVERVLNDELKEPSKLGIEISENTENALMNALNVYQQERTQSAAAFLEELNSSSVQRIRTKKKSNKTGHFPLWAKGLIACLIGAVVIGGSVLAMRIRSDNVKMENVSNRIVMPNLSGMTLQEAQETLDSLKEEAEKLGIHMEFQIKKKNTEFDLDAKKNGTIASQSVKPRECLYDASLEKQKKLSGVKRDKDGNVSGTITCRLYSNTTLHYRDLSDLSNAYEIAKKLGLDTGDQKQFQGERREGTNYYDLLTLNTPDGAITDEELQNSENRNKTITYQKDKMNIVYSNVPFFYSEALPDFKGAYGTLSNIPAFDAYIWKDEKTPQPSGEQKRLEEFAGMVDGEYCAIAYSSGSNGYNVGDIIEQTVPAGTKLDMSKEKLEQPLLKVIGEEVLYGGKTGYSVEDELIEKWGNSITIIREGSGVMSQPVDYVSVTDDDGNPLQYFRKGQAVMVNLDLRPTPTPEPVDESESFGSGGSSGGGGYSGGGGSSGSGPSMNPGGR